MQYCNVVMFILVQNFGLIDNHYITPRPNGSTKTEVLDICGRGHIGSFRAI